MMLSCKLCGHQINSVLTGAKARTYVIDQLMYHLTKQHKEQTAELAAAISAVSGYLAVRMFGTLQDGDTDLRAGLADTERDLFAVISGDVVTRLRDVMMMEKPRGGQGGAN